ncbi:MAG: hypothetical protein WBD53_13480 [Xanthobacteraceae bacterium]
MTGDIAKSVEEGREHAATCARKAESVLEQETREDFPRLEQGWLQLVRSYEFAQAAMKDAGRNAMAPK